MSLPLSLSFLPELWICGCWGAKAVCHILFLPLSLSFSWLLFNAIIRRALLLAATAAGQETWDRERGRGERGEGWGQWEKYLHRFFFSFQYRQRVTDASRERSHSLLLCILSQRRSTVCIFVFVFLPRCAFLLRTSRALSCHIQVCATLDFRSLQMTGGAGKRKGKHRLQSARHGRHLSASCTSPPPSLRAHLSETVRTCVTLCSRGNPRAALTFVRLTH